MSAYIARRVLLMFPTLLGILFVSFIVVQFAPGGPRRARDRAIVRRRHRRSLARLGLSGAVISAHARRSALPATR